MVVLFGLVAWGIGCFGAGEGLGGVVRGGGGGRGGGEGCGGEEREEYILR